MKMRKFRVALVAVLVVLAGLGGSLEAMHSSTKEFALHKRDFMGCISREYRFAKQRGDDTQPFLCLHGCASEASDVTDLNELIEEFNRHSLTRVCGFKPCYPTISQGCNDIGGSYSGLQRSKAEEFVPEKTLVPTPEKDIVEQEIGEILQTISEESFHAAVLAFRYKCATEMHHEKRKLMQRELAFAFALEAILEVGGSAAQKGVLAALFKELEKDIARLNFDVAPTMEGLRAKMSEKTLRDSLSYVRAAMQATEKKFCTLMTVVQHKILVSGTEGTTRGDLELFTSWVRACGAMERAVLCAIGVIDHDMAASLVSCNNDVVCTQPPHVVAAQPRHMLNDVAVVGAETSVFAARI